MPRAPGRAEPEAGDAVRRDLLVFVTVVIASALFLQRFGLPVGGKSVNVAGPVGLVAAAWGLLRGALQFSRTRLRIFLLLCVLVAVGLVVQNSLPRSFPVELSMESLLQFLLLTGFATLCFTHPLGETEFFRRVTALISAVAVAGLLQFAAQFVGLSIFSFRGLVPDSLLFETGYNLEIPLDIGSLLKANGFFLLEPSIFSQFMAFGIIIEALTLQRPRILALFAGGLIASASGTGWLVLATFAVTVVFSLGGRGVVIAVGTIAATTVSLLALKIFVPDLFGMLEWRMNELAQPGTSGHLRFVTPFWVLDDVLGRDPMSLLVGIGAGVSERLTLPYEFAMNTPVKLVIEFGAPALILYLCLICAGSKSPVQRALLLPGLMLLLAAGGYQQLPPILFPILLTLSVARLVPEADDGP